MRATTRAAVPLLAAALTIALGQGCGDSRRPSSPVVVIGLDGATWDLLQPWIDAGDLPTLGDLQRTSAWGELQSVVPYLSPPAWTSAVTGVNPGKHAIFDFQRRVPGELAIVNETAKSRRAQPIWSMLTAAGRRVLVLNVPMSDPPDPVNGLFIAGFPHPDPVGFTYPPELEAQLPDYPLDDLAMKIREGEEDSLMAAYLSHLEKRKQIVLQWLRGERFDLLWAVFTGTDRMQHLYWKFTDPQSPYYDPEAARRFGRAIHDYWVVQDAALGEICAAVPAEASLFVLSDHGFGPLRYTLEVGQFLRRDGSSLSEREAAAVQALDPNDACRLYIPRKGREPGAMYTTVEAQRLRVKLMSELQGAQDPLTGTRVCERVWTNEDVFRGTYAEKGPDVVVLPADGYFLSQRGAPALEGRPAIAAYGPQLSGWHRMNGLYVLRGPSVSPGKRSRGSDGEFSLLDVVPTVLYLLAEPIPQGLDGTLMRGVIEADYLAKHPPAGAPPLEEDYRETTPEELENLKNLPYIGG